MVSRKNALLKVGQILSAICLIKIENIVNRQGEINPKIPRQKKAASLAKRPDRPKGQLEKRKL